MSTARPLFSFLNISGAIYGYVPGPLLLDVIVTWAACFSSVTPIPQTNTPLRFLVIYQIRIQEKTARINLKLHLLCYLKLTSTFRGLYTQGIWLSIVLQQTLFWYILRFNRWPFRLATPSGSIMESNIWTVLLPKGLKWYIDDSECVADKINVTNALGILVYLLTVSSYFVWRILHICRYLTLLLHPFSSLYIQMNLQFANTTTHTEKNVIFRY